MGTGGTTGGERSSYRHGFTAAGPREPGRRRARRRRAVVGRAASFAVEQLEDRRLLAIAFAGVADQNVTEGTPASLGGLTFTDAGDANLHKLKINWGDGTAPQTLSLTPDPDDGYTCYPVRTHAYNAAGDYTVSLLAWDNATPLDTTPASFTAHVAAAPPVVRIGATPARVSAGQTVTLGLDVSDPGGDHVSAWDVDWGDGSAVGHYDRDPDVDPEPTPTHVYTSLGRHVVSVTPTDDDFPAGLPAVNKLTYDAAFGAGGDGVFSGGGVVRTNVIDNDTPWDFATAIANAADGRLLVGGISESSFVVAKYLADGTLDTTFGANADGKAVLSMNQGGVAYGATVSSMAVQADGKVVVAGDRYSPSTHAYDFVVARFDADGTLDTTFGTGGKVVTDFGTAYDRANAVAVDPATGAITLAGFAGPDVAVARYTSAGAPDTTFGPNADGKVIANMGSVHDIGYAVGFDSQGRVVVAGRSEGDLFVARFLEDGTADMSFNTTGRQVVSPGADASASSLAFDADDSIVVAGAAGGHATILRFDEDGTMDALVGSGTGYVTAAAFDAPYSNLYSVSVDAAGRILAGGSLGGQRMLVARYNADGTPDTTFGGGPAGGDGWTSAYISTNRGEADAIGAVSADGMITAVGTSLGAEGGMYNFAIGRFLPDNAITVHAIAPTVSIADGGGNPATPVEGDTFHLALSASSNPGEDPITSWVIHAGPRDVTVSGNPTTYDLPLPSGTYDITADALGAEGLYPASGAIPINVVNSSPTLVSIGSSPSSPKEGDSVVVSMVAADAGGADLLNYMWLVTKNGATFASGAGADAEFVPDDEGTYVATIDATDNDGETVSASSTVIASNAVPSAHLGDDFDVNQAEQVNFTGWGSDPGDADVLTYEWTVTGPDDEEVAAGTSADVSFLPEKPGAFSVEMVVTDDSNETASDTIVVTANNLAPMIFTPGAPAAVDAEGGYLLPLTLSDAGADDTVSYDVDWGDGTTHATGTPTTRTAGLTHPYAGYTAKGNHYQLDQRTVTVTATDQDDASSSDSFPVAADYWNNFDDNDAGGWTGQSYLFGDGTHYFALRSDDGTLTLNRSNLPTHQGLLIEFDLLLGGVDGEWKAEDLDFPTTQFTATLGGATIEPESIDAPNGSGEPLPQPIEGLSYYAVSWHVRYVVPDASSTLTLALTGSGLRTGDEDQDFGINNVHVGLARLGEMTAYRTGGRIGQPVYHEYLRGTDPSNYLVLTNNDVEETADPLNPSDAGNKDFDDDVAAGGSDDDLAEVTLRKVPSAFTKGTVELELSDPSAVRIFKDDGTMLHGPTTGTAALTVDLASPSGYLAGLTSSDKTLWFEGLKADSDFSLSLVFRNGDGAEIGRQDVHLTLAEYSIRDMDGEPLSAVPTVEQSFLMDLPSSTDMAAALRPFAYKFRLDGLPVAGSTTIRLASDLGRLDFPSGEMTGGSDRTEPADFIIAYVPELQTPLDRGIAERIKNAGGKVVPVQDGSIATKGEKTDQEKQWDVWDRAADAMTWRIDPDGNDFNVIPATEIANPAAIIKVTAAEQADVANTALIRLTDMPKEYKSGQHDDDAKIYWKIDDPDKADFFTPPGGSKDDSGTKVRIVGKALGRIKLTAYLMKGTERNVQKDEALDSYEAVVVNLKEIKYRALVARETPIQQGKPIVGASSTPVKVKAYFEQANVLLRQLGIRLVPDTTAPAAGISATDFPGIFTKFDYGRGKTTSVVRKDVLNGTKFNRPGDLSTADQLIKDNYVKGVLNINFIHFFGKDQEAYGMTVSFPKPPRTFLELKYRIKDGWPVETSHKMYMNTSYGGQGRNGGNQNENWGILIADGLHNSQDRGQTIAHEVGHFLGLQHRITASYMSSPPQPNDGLRQPERKNLMALIASDNAFQNRLRDFDLIQVWAVHNLGANGLPA